ncbi:MAG: endonuclease domain-containing protein, partial [Vulcanimicrobiaceae bacterium]
CRLPESESDRSGGRYGKTRVPRLHVDHDHRTNEVRGLLCRWCNQMLGSAKDDPARLRGAIDYLSRFRPAQEAAELIVA